jgi:cysteine desulfurase
LCQSKGVLFHTDAVQWFGKMPFSSIAQFNANLVSGCAHKLYGPKGAGFLYVKSPLHLQPLILGGPQENELRAGTENLPQIIGLVSTFAKYVHEPVFKSPVIDEIKGHIRAFLSETPYVNVISPSLSLPNTIAFTVPETESLALLANLDLAGFYASSGAACTSGALQPSHVLLGMGLSKSDASSLVRLSFGRQNTLAEAERFKEAFPGILKRSINRE